MYSYLTYICYSYIYVTYMQHICGFGKGSFLVTGFYSTFNFTPSRASRQHACQVSFAVSRLGGHEKVAEVTHGLPVIILCKTS